MRMRLFFALLWLVFAVETLPQPPKSLVVTHISVVDVSTGETKPDMTVIISDGRIREIGSSTTARIPEAAQVVEAGGKFLIPGLWDMHVTSSIRSAAAHPIRGTSRCSLPMVSRAFEKC